MITRGKPASHQIAVTLRRNLSAAVSNALVESQSPDVIDSLLRNPTAEIAPSTREMMVELSRSMTPIQKPLLQRTDLPADLAWRMYGWVGSALKTFIVDTFPETGTDFGSEIDDVIERAMATSLEPSTTEPESISTQDLLRVLETESLEAFQNVFARFSGLPLNDVPAILSDAGGESMAIVCKACGVPIQDFLRIFELLSAQLSSGAQADTTEFSAVRTFFERLEIKSANSILSEWRSAKR